MKIYDYNGLKNLCGAQIRRERQRQRLTQEQLAARLQCRGVILERDSVSRIESGTRFIADFELLAIAEILGLSADCLLRREIDQDGSSCGARPASSSRPAF